MKQIMKKRGTFTTVISVTGLDEQGEVYGDITSVNRKERHLKEDIYLQFGNHNGECYPTLEEIDRAWYKIIALKGRFFFVHKGEVTLTIAEEGTTKIETGILFPAVLAWDF